MPLQQGELLRKSWFFEFQRGQDLGLFGTGRRESGVGLCAIQGDTVMLDATQLSQCSFW